MSRIIISSMIKRAAKKVTINFTPEEHKLLEGVAMRDKREKATEVRWLVQAYAEGELMSAADWARAIQGGSRQIGNQEHVDVLGMSHPTPEGQSGPGESGHTKHPEKTDDYKKTRQQGGK